MSYLRDKPRRLKDGTLRHYWYQCETYWEEGRSHERILKYVGTNPNVRIFPLEETLARKVAPVVAQQLSPTDLREKLRDLGFDLPFRPRQVDFRNIPPLRRLSLRIE